MLRLLLIMMLMMPSVAMAQPMDDLEAAIIDKDYEQARQLAKDILKQHADSKIRIKAEYYLGLSQLRLGQYVAAREAFYIVMNATQDKDLYEKAALGLIEGLHMAGFYRDALKEGEALLRRNERSSSKSLIYLKIARANLKLMQWQNAKEYLQKIINEFPQSFEAPIAKGLLEEKEFFSVQIGAFKEKTKALDLVKELKAKKQYAYIIETTAINGDKLYRVRIGQMSSLDQAQQMQATLSRQGYPSLIYP